MATQLITVLCEGPHDVAFICKILKSIGFKANENTPLAKYPVPINQLFQQAAKKSNVNELNLQTVRHLFLPSNSLVKDGDYIFLYVAGSDSKILSRLADILDSLLAFIPQRNALAISALPENTFLSLICFLDADQKGINTRLSELNKAFEKYLGKDLFKKHSEVITKDTLKVGNYIFSGANNNTGKLEDILIPLMADGNEAIFGDAKQYLDTHFDQNRLKDKFYEEKSIIGIAGQLQKSGSSNVVCISQADYLNDEKIYSNEKCVEIIAFFKSFLTTPNE